MGFYDEEQNVTQYLAIADGYDGAALVELLTQHAAPGATVLELGMGPGKDVDLLLRAGFRATGSDSSTVFLERYRARGGAAPTLTLDACTIETAQRFDVIYSNKVLQHLTRAQLRASLARQAEVVQPRGLLLHALWYGEGEDQHHGLRFTKYNERTLAAAVPATLELIASERYAEMEDGDSLWALLRRR